MSFASSPIDWQSLKRNVSAVDLTLLTATVSFIPMLWIQSSSLWGRPHFQFFPIAWLAFVYFLYCRRNDLNQSPSSIRFWVGITGLVVSLIGAAEALFISSPWLSQASFFVAICSWLLIRVGSAHVMELVLLSGMLWVTLPLPAGYDEKLVRGLQALSSSSASLIMDGLGIMHVREGNILQLLEKRLFVDEACSGIDSLYALMAISIALVIWLKQRWYVALFSLSMVPLWAACSNLIRLETIVLFEVAFGIDLSSGWPHTLLGLFTFGIAFICDLCFINFVGEVLEIRRPKGERATSPTLTADTSGNSDTPGLVEQKGVKFDWRRAKYVFPTISILFLLLGGYSTRVLSKSTMHQYPEFTSSSLEQLEKSLIAPTVPSNWKLAKNEKVERSVGDAMGRFSHVWLYAGANGSAMFSVDFPFRGFHLLDICYEGAGWQQASPRRIFEDSPTLGQFHELDLKKDTGEYTFVTFVQYQLSGAPVRSKSIGRGFERFEQTFLEPITFQIQCLVASNTPLSESEKEAVRALIRSNSKNFQNSFQNLEAIN